MKIAWFSDFNIKGSGYLSISAPLCAGLAALGHDVKAIALNYHGEEHTYGFSLLPTRTIADGINTIQHLYNYWGFDVLIVALDIPVQEQILNAVNSAKSRPFKYVGIMPVEADPLSMKFAAAMFSMDKVFIISQFGTEEAQKAGIEAEHLVVGLDSESWRMPTEDERKKLRSAYGFAEDEFVVLTVADNQERKNHWANMRAIKHVRDDFGVKVRYVMVTNEHAYVGWSLRELANTLGISQELMIFERGVTFANLWSLYACADAFLLLSKAEGLGLPLLEAMSVGVPCVGTDCTGISELLADQRGYVVSTEYQHIDPFGNGNRYWANPSIAAYFLDAVAKGYIKKECGREYVESRTHEKSTLQIHQYLEGLNEKAE